MFDSVEHGMGYSNQGVIVHVIYSSPYWTTAYLLLSTNLLGFGQVCQHNYSIMQACTGEL